MRVGCHCRNKFFNGILKSLGIFGRVFLHDDCTNFHSDSEIAKYIRGTSLEDLDVGFGFENSPDTLKSLCRTTVIKNTRASDFGGALLAYDVPTTLHEYLLYLDI